MPRTRLISPPALALLAGSALLVLGAALARAESADDARLRQLAGQAGSYAGEVRSLLAKGADPNVPDRDGRTAVHGAAAISAVETMQALLAAGGNPDRRDKDGNAPLHLASAAPLLSGAVPTIRLLLRAKADPGIANGEGRTALHVAASHHEQPEAVDALVAHGADANRKDRWGSTALHAAVGPNPGWPGWSGAGLPGIVQALLAGGADPRLSDGEGLSALQRFVREGTGSGETAALLIEAGADSNGKYPNGEAPLHAAVRTGGTRGKVAVAEALLAGGADPCIRDAQDFYPYSIATEGGPIHRALDRAERHDLGCQGQGETISLDADQRRRVQEALAALGFDPGPADGKFGPRTRRAIGGWQQANGHAATGELTNGQVEALLANAAPLERFGPNWSIVENQPCQVWNYGAAETLEPFTWSGACVDGKASGEGRLTLSGIGASFQGEMADGKPHGRGTLTETNGAGYEGGWRHGMWHGYGTSTWADGTRYEGEWRDGVEHGHGTLTETDGDRYEGGWRHGMWDGYGTLTWADGTGYEGGWRHGKPHGHGTYTRTDGGRYEGEWHDGCSGVQDGRRYALMTSAADCGFE